ncbi:MAG: hypothetical protein IH945_05745 [Armatimonadetes bacterium]|nr:hypothetical protein [Armatimonadota bacterium]
MLVKVVTTALALLGLAMLAGLPFVLRERPPDDDQAELAKYGAWLITYFGATCLIWLSAALSAMLVMRAARRQLVEDQKENLKGMIEGTLRDHERKR